MATTKKYLDEDGLVQYTGKVKKAINDASYTHGVTDIDGTTTAPTVANTVNATANQRSATFTKNGSSDTFPYYDTTYGTAVAGSKDGLMSRTDKTKLDGIATGAEVNVQSDWNQTSTSADDYIKNKPAVNKVKITEHTASTSTTYPVLMSASSVTSGNDYEAGYDSSFNFAPATNALMIGSGSLTESSYSGRAAKTESDLAKSGNGGNGAEMVGYEYRGGTPSKEIFEGLVSVNDALEALIGEVDDMSLDGDNVEVGVNGTNLNISSGDSLDTVVGVIDTAFGTKQDTLTAGTNITFSGTGNTTINAADEKVGQNKTTNNADYHLLLTGGDGSADRAVSESKFSTNLDFNPSTKVMKLTSSYTQGAGGASTTFDTQINVGGEGVTIVKKQGSTTLATGTISATNYSGTSAKATADGSGNNIVNTYATKAALDELTNKWTGQFKIATSAEATAIAQGDASSLQLGYIYLVLDSTASSPNVYDEYIKVALGTSPETYSVEKIGTTDAGVDVVSLTTAEINTIWATTAAAS